jgi:hypothetical protein
MAKTIDNYLVISGKRYSLTRRKKLKVDSNFVNHEGTFFTLTELEDDVNLAGIKAAPPFVAEIAEVAVNEANTFTQATVQAMLHKAVQLARRLPELTWAEIENVHIGDDLQNPPGGKKIWVSLIQSEFNRQLRMQFPEIMPLGDGFLWNWSVGHPQETYGHMVLVIHGFLNPTS